MARNEISKATDNGDPVVRIVDMAGGALWLVGKQSNGGYVVLWSFDNAAGLFTLPAANLGGYGDGWLDASENGFFDYLAAIGVEYTTAQGYEYPALLEMLYQAVR